MKSQSIFYRFSMFIVCERALGLAICMMKRQRASRRANELACAQPFELISSVIVHAKLRALSVPFEMFSKIVLAQIPKRFDQIWDYSASATTF